jgi:small-conductance mechanosensitive channel
MNSADSATSGALLQLTSPQMLAAGLAILAAGAMSILAARLMTLMVARTLRARHQARDAVTGLPPPAAHSRDQVVAAAVILVPFLAGFATLLAAHVVAAAFGAPTEAIGGAVRLGAALLALRLGVHVVGLLLGPGSWVRTREGLITFAAWLILVVVMLGWLDVIQASLNRISLVPGKTQFSLWAVLKGLVVVTAFVLATSLIARAIERQVMRLDELAVSTRVGISKFTYFLLMGLGVLLGINAAGVDITTLNVLFGAIGLGLGFGLQAVASNFVSGFVLLMDKSIKPGDVISFGMDTSGSSDNFGWVQELRGRYVVVRDRDGIDTLVPNQNLITNSFINWSYSNQLVRLKLPVIVSYEQDPEVALKLLAEAAQDHPRILDDPPPVSRLISFDANGMRLECRFWIADPVNGVNNVRSDVNRAIWRIFHAHGVRMIPTPQHEMRFLEAHVPLAAADVGARPPVGLGRAAE